MGRRIKSGDDKFVKHMGFLLPLVVGHRGAGAYAPENTLEGIREAARRGARAVEFDAKLSADGIVVLLHDATLDRTTNGRGDVAKATYAELARLDAGTWFGEPWRGARVPTLVQALDLLVRLDLAASVEIKPSPGRDAETAVAIAEVILAHWPPARPWPLLSSFSRVSLAAARQAAPELPRGLLVWEHPEDWQIAARNLGCISLHPSTQHLTSDWAAAIREAGYALAVYTVNDSARARELLAWGAQCLISDCPDIILAAVAGTAVGP